MRQKHSRFDFERCVFHNRLELVPLFFLGNHGGEVLHFDSSFANENHLRHGIDSGHPGIADQLGIKSGDTDWFFCISGRGCFPLQQARLAIQFADGVDVGNETCT